MSLQGLSAVMAGTGSAIGEEKIPNSYFEKDIIYTPDGKPDPDYNPNKMKEIVGIKFRRITCKPLTELMIDAISDLLDSTKIKLEEVDALICATNSMYYHIEDVSEPIYQILKEKYKTRFNLGEWNPLKFTAVSGCPSGEVA